MLPVVCTQCGAEIDHVNVDMHYWAREHYTGKFYDIDECVEEEYEPEVNVILEQAEHCCTEDEDDHEWEFMCPNCEASRTELLELVRKGSSKVPDGRYEVIGNIVPYSYGRFDSLSEAEEVAEVQSSILYDHEQGVVLDHEVDNDVLDFVEEIGGAAAGENEAALASERLRAWRNGEKPSREEVVADPDEPLAAEAAVIDPLAQP